MQAAISEGHGDAAVCLLRAGAESDKRDQDGYLAIDLAPDKSVSMPFPSLILDSVGQAVAEMSRVDTTVYLTSS